MKKKTIFLALAASAMMTALPVDADAQSRRKAAVKKAPQLTEEELARQARIEEMEYATQKIVFIDSVVVDKDNMIAAVGLPQEAGSFANCGDVFGNSSFSDVAFVNEMGNRCYLSGKDANGRMQLYSSDRIDGRWSQPLPIDGLESLGDNRSLYCPFVMADGITLYFAATGEESIGGYDIFVTRYNADENKFFRPENVGMPFNSTANDYFFIVDEYDKLGWFATDRNQPEGKVCIYTFIPTDSRNTYGDFAGDEERKRLSSIHSIADTWGNGSERNMAIERLKLALARQNERSSSNDDAFEFVINDNTVYTSVSQFKAEGNLERYVKLCDLKMLLEKNLAELEKHRSYYSTADKAERAAIKGEMLAKESECESFELQIRNLEKEIRYAENQEILR